MKQTACLVDALGRKLKTFTGSAGETGILARRVFREGNFDIIGPGGEILLPVSDRELTAYYLPGEYRPSRSNYNQKKLSFSLSVFLFASEAPISPLELAETFRGKYTLEGSKTADVEPESFTEDVLAIIQNFPRYREQYQDKQTIGFAQLVKLGVSILNCC